jgi:hypothetical protein
MVKIRKADGTVKIRTIRIIKVTYRKPVYYGLGGVERRERVVVLDIHDKHFNVAEYQGGERVFSRKGIDLAYWSGMIVADAKSQVPSSLPGFKIVKTVEKVYYL